MGSSDVPRRARAAVIAGSLLAAAAACAQPAPDPGRCPDGRPRTVIQHADAGGIPADATSVDCGDGQTCYVSAVSTCLDLIGVTEVLPAARDPGRPTTRPAPTTLPPGVRPLDPGTDFARPPDTKPLNPYGTDRPRPAPTTEHCSAGEGWDFETLAGGETLPTYASLDGWESDGAGGSPFVSVHNSDIDILAAPVYGNAVPIDRIQPPGWTNATQTAIGGDYWIYSQSINQHGSFWLSSFYRRYSWGQHPGVDWGEAAVGTLTSPPCTLRARYLTFRASGGYSASERVEVQVRGGRPRDYFGIEFVDAGGAFGLGARQLDGQLGYATQFPPVSPAASQAFPPPTSGWTVLRTVAPDRFLPGGQLESEWMQLYVLDLAAFAGQEIRIRIVDDRNTNCAIRKPGGCAVLHPAHINVDDVLFADEAPDNVSWYAYATRDPRGVGCPRDARPHGDERIRCRSPIGVVPSQPPLWGITDAHAHPMANLAFGGHVFWGDPRDPESRVYDCSQTLDAIPGPGGHPTIVPGEQTSCYLNGEFVAAVAGVAQAPCALLGAVPLVGGVGVALCVGAVKAAAAIAANTPTLRLLRLHGAHMGASGAVAFGAFLADALQSVLDLVGEHLQGFALAAIPGLVPEIDKSSLQKKDFWRVSQFVLNAGWLGKLDWYPEKAKWHATTGVSKLHNRYLLDGIRRAYAGGLRLAVWDVINSRVFALAADGRTDTPDWQALKDQTDAAKAIVGALGASAQIAYSPEEADAIVRSGRLAIVLGSEVDELGRLRPDGLPWPRSPHTPPDTMRKQVDDLWELGIRKISPVHSSNNPIGGAAIFNKDYVANNHFLNSTPVDAPPSLLDLPAVKAILRLAPTSIVKQLVLGNIVPLSWVGDAGRQPWNPEGWFEFGPPPGATAITPAGEDGVTYRVGQDDSPSKVLRDGNGWLPPKDVLGDQIKTVRVLNDISYVVKTDDKCQTKNLVFPGQADEFTPAVNAEFVASAGHRNKLGLYVDGGEDGTAFLRAAMQRGMLIAADHMSQRMRIDFYALAAAYAAEAGRTPCSAGQACPDYPVMSEHATLREVEKEGSSFEHLVGDFGANDETTKPLQELDYLAARASLIGVFPRPTLIPPNTSGGQCRRNSDCAAWNGDASSAACSNGVCAPEPTQTSFVGAAGTLSSVATPALVPRNFDLPSEVENDCDGSSKSFATKYLVMLRRMQGHGLTLTTDMNGLNSTGYPRYGWRVPGSDGCGKGDRATTLPYLRANQADVRDWPTRMRQRQEVEGSGVWYTSYSSRVPLVSPLVANIVDPKRPPANKRWKVVAARQLDEAREDHLPLYVRNDDEQRTPMRPDYVYYNDFGPDLEWGQWKRQRGNAKGAQLYPMIPERRRDSGWDFNLDGFQQIGSLPDLLQDMRNVGVQWEQVEPLLHGAQDFIASWQKAKDLAQAHP